MVSARLAADAPIYGLAYYRISGAKEQRDSALSIPTQRDFVLPAMEREGVVFVDERHDVLTGKRDDRPGYQQILAIARRLRMEGKRVAVFVLRLDRFGRDTLERARAWKEMSQKDIRLYSVTGGGWQEDAFLYDLDSALAAREVRITGDRVRNINSFIRGRGYPILHRIAWGYRTREASADERADGCGHKTLEPHPDEAPYVREAFERRARGDTYGSIHAWIATLPPSARGARSMPIQVVYAMFNAPVYVARHEYPKGSPEEALPVLERPIGKWEPIVSDDLWLRVQRQNEEHRRFPRQASGAYLLTGFLKCPECGDRLCGRTAAPGRYHRYGCVSFSRGADHPSRQGRACWWSGSARQLDAAARAHVGRMLAAFADPVTMSILEEGWEMVRQEAAGEDDTPRQIAALEARRGKYASARDAAYIDWKSGEIGGEQYRSVAATAEAEMAVADRELAVLRSRLSPIDELPPWREVLSFVRAIVPIYESGSIDEQRLVLARLWNSAVPIKLGYNRYDIDPDLTELGHRLLQVAAQLSSDERLVHLYKSLAKRTVK